MIIKRKSVVKALGFVGLLFFVSTHLRIATHEHLLETSHRVGRKIRHHLSGVNLSAPGRFVLLCMFSIHIQYYSSVSFQKANWVVP